MTICSMSFNILIFIILIFLLSIKSLWIENMKTKLDSLEASDLPKGKRRWSKQEGDDQKWEKMWETGKRKWGCENMLDRGETCKSRKYNIE